MSRESAAVLALELSAFFIVETAVDAKESRRRLAVVNFCLREEGDKKFMAERSGV